MNDSTWVYSDIVKTLTFLVKKKRKATYCFSVSVVRENTVTMGNAGIQPNVEEYAKASAGYTISSLLNFYTQYGKVTLDKGS